MQPIEDSHTALGVVPACVGFSRAGDALVARQRAAGALLAATLRERARRRAQREAQRLRIADRAETLADSIRGFIPYHEMSPIERPCSCDICTGKS